VDKWFRKDYFKRKKKTDPVERVFGEANITIKSVGQVEILPVSLKMNSILRDSYPLYSCNP
jgi:hypothetical protein